MKKIFIFLLLASFIVGFSQTKNLGVPNNDTLDIVNHYFYIIGYSEKHEQPGWVTYSLSQKDTVIKYNKRKSFTIDDLIVTKSATNSDYKNSGYDRGHMVPAADMRWDFSAYVETFKYSNASPQIPNLNRGKWKVLESKVRNLLQTYEIIYIVTGPILTNGLPTIGKNEVSIPNFYYKAIVVFDGVNYKGFAFLLPNKKTTYQLEDCMVTINFIEAMTGYDFFPHLPIDIENNVESMQSKKWW